jgi:hypothetical protein
MSALGTAMTTFNFWRMHESADDPKRLSYKASRGEVAGLIAYRLIQTPEPIYRGQDGWPAEQNAYQAEHRRIQAEILALNDHEIWDKGWELLGEPGSETERDTREAAK